MSNNERYEVGYAKPPKDRRWKKGQSGNPRGRPKGSRGLRTDLDKELDARLSISVKGETMNGTTQQLMLRLLARRAAHGDVRASRVLLDLILGVFGSGDRGVERDELSAQDQAVFDRLMSEIYNVSADDAGPDVDCGATSCDGAELIEGLPDELEEASPADNEGEVEPGIEGEPT